MYHVFYHDPCNDGEVSKIVWKYFESNSIFYPWKHNNHTDQINIINKLPDNSNIVFLDLTPIIENLSDKHNYIIIDHHKNAIESLVNKKPTLPTYKIELYTQRGFPENNNLSGCMLTWGYFTKSKYPSIVNYIGNKDVWNFSDPNTELYCIGYDALISEHYDRDEYIINLIDYNDDINIIDVGKRLIESYKETAIDIFNNSVKTNIESINDYNYNIIDINCSNYTLFKYLIEYAQLKYPDYDVLRILQIDIVKMKTYSLRSLKDNIKVDGIARYYGGNGHEKASGYSIYN